MDGRYVLIIGHGRSGTNWLLDMLDQHPRTHGRNEPSELENSPFKAIPTKLVDREQPADFGQRWREAVRLTAASGGERDHRHGAHKRHIRPISRQVGLVRVMESRRARAVMGLVSSRWRKPEWPMPGWVVDPAEFETALPVLKINQAPGWGRWVLDNDPEARVLHIVRHPGGFLNSWKKRYLSQKDQEFVTDENRKRLRLVAEASPLWAAKFGDIEAMPADESELWYWRYAVETVDAAGAGKSNYRRIIYEDLAKDPMGMAREIYGFCGLDWSAEVERGLAAKGGESESIARAWRERLGASEVALIDGIVRESRMRGWWEVE